MKRLLTLAAILFGAGIALLSSNPVSLAQFSLMVQGPAAGGAAYVGPGDTGGTAFVAYMFGRAFNAADATAGASIFTYSCAALGAAPGTGGTLTMHVQSDGKVNATDLTTMKTDCLVASVSAAALVNSGGSPASISGLGSTAGLQAGLTVDLHSAGSNIRPGTVTNGALSGGVISVNRFFNTTSGSTTVDFYNVALVSAPNRGNPGTCDLDTNLTTGLLVDPASQLANLVPIVTEQAHTTTGIKSSGTCSSPAIPYTYWGIAEGSSTTSVPAFLTLDSGAFTSAITTSSGGKFQVTAGSSAVSVASMSATGLQSVGALVATGSTGKNFLAGTTATGLTTGTNTTTSKHTMIFDDNWGSTVPAVGEVMVFSSDQSANFGTLQSAACTAYTGGASC